MARPMKIGLDYFPLDVDADTDEKIEYVIAKKGFITFGVYIRLLMGIYKDGYFTRWSEQKLFVYAKRMMMPPEELSAIISEFIEVGLFSKEMFDKGILTSASIQKRYLNCTEKRKYVEILPQYNLVSDDVNSEKTTTDRELIPNLSRSNEVNSELSTQSKVKESKVNNNNNSNELLSSDDDATVKAKTVVEHYHIRCPSLQKVNGLTTNRRTTINARMRELKTLDALDAFLDKVEQSDFITGRDGVWQGKRGIDWIFKQSNFMKILEGNYDNKSAPSQLPTMTEQEKAELAKKRAEQDEYYKKKAEAEFQREYGGLVNDTA